jgi:hypothetical protein
MPPQTLESRIESVEHRVTRLEELPSRIDDLTLQVSQLRTEMSVEFSAVRAEMATGSEMRALYEDAIARIALMHEGGTVRKPRKQSKKT